MRGLEALAFTTELTESTEKGMGQMPICRAKFKCVNVDRKGVDENSRDANADIRFEPVTCGSKENEEFFKWTPGGVIQLSCVNPAVNKQFEAGKEYYIDFTPAE